MINKPLSPKSFFEDLNKFTMNLVDDFYDEQALFLDPIVHLSSRSS